MNIIIQKYIEYAIEHEKYILSGDFKNANKAHKKLTQIIENIRVENEMCIRDRS